MHRKIIGVSGTNGAGKDTFSSYWVERTNASRVGLGDILRGQLPASEMRTRKNLAALSARLREAHGLAVMVDLAVEQYQHAAIGGLVINGVRHPAEAARVQELGGTMVWIDAPVEVRYRRVTETDRGRPEDNVSFDQFRDEELQEMTSNSEAAVNLTVVRDLANIAIVNSHETVDGFRRQIDELFFNN